MSILRATFICLILAGCAGEVPLGGKDDFGGYGYGEWSKPVSAGENKWLTKGWDTAAVMNGSQAFCEKEQGMSIREVLDLTPGDYAKASTLIFSCKK
jgi:hypothetical protein|tara:strand:- start:29 stop:319 length:291 start_codon:yes stop_codon:yes gene_type:complete